MNTTAEEKTPRKIKLRFPMTLDKFLRLALPDVRTPDRRRAWRKFIEAHPPGSVIITNDKGEGNFAETMANLHDAKICNEMAYFLAMKQFAGWYPYWRKSETAKVRSDAGRRKKRKARPPVGKLKEILEEHDLT